MRTLMKIVAAAAAAGMALAAATAGTASASSVLSGARAVGTMDEGLETGDKLIFRNGREVEGEILKEDDSTIQMRVVSGGGLSAVMTYNKSEILVVERGAEDDKKGDKPAKPAARAESAKPKSNSNATEAAAKVYVVKLKGEFGRDISETPLEDVVKDARNHQVDYIVVELDNEFKWYGQELPDYVHLFDQLFRAEEIDPILTDNIRDDSEWKTKPQVVFWVKKAMGGAAFLPLSCPNIYFHSEGLMGGIGRVEETVQGGDEVVREKLFSARMGHVEGMAIRGGHAPELVRAMCRTEYVLSVSFAGGRPVYHPDDSGEILLTDDGQDDREDESPINGNDVLTLNAEIAYRLGFSKATVDTLDDLLFDLGVARDYKLVEGRSERIMKEWSNRVEDAERNIRRLYGKMQDTPLGGATYEERTRSRGVHIRAWKEIRSTAQRFSEAINPRNLPQPMGVDQLVTTANLQIEQLEQAQRNDRR